MRPIRRAALYVRVSTDEQAERGYSLRDQEERLRTWCVREGVDVAEVYVEEGASAKTFERRQWARLLTRIEAGRATDIDAVLVVKWDRFSRDATGALGMIRRLDARGVAVQAIEQPIDTSVPEQLLMQVLYVAAPEVENRRRSQSVKAGMRRAMTEGRWVHSPPVGYTRGHDAAGRYLLVPGVAAAHVREAFRLAAETARPLEHIRKDLWAGGLRIGRVQFTNLLRHGVYAGRIVIPAWGSEPAADVAGVHEPLVSEALFARVQARRFARPDARSVARRRLVPELPLRGHLLCPRSGVRLTGSASRSRNGSRVWYYHGQGTGAYRVGAEAAHGAFAGYLASVRLAPRVAALLRALADERGSAGAAARRRALGEARAALEAAETKLLAVDTRYLDGDLDRDSRDRLLEHFRAARAAAHVALSDATEADDAGASHLHYAVGVLERLPDVWAGTTPEARDALAGSMWPSGLVFDGARYRTAVGDDLIGLLVGVRAENEDGDPCEKGRRPVGYARVDSNHWPLVPETNALSS